MDLVDGEFYWIKPDRKSKWRPAKCKSNGRIFVSIYRTIEKKSIFKIGEHIQKPNE